MAKKQPKLIRKEKVLRKKSAKLNKSLLSMPTSTQNSMGIISVDKDGIFRLKGDRWIKVFIMASSIPFDVRNHILSNTKTRIRETLISGNTGKRYYMSISCTAKDIKEAKEIINFQAGIINEKGMLYPLDIQKTMQEIHDNYLFAGINNYKFNFAKEVRGKKRDWKSICSLKGEAKETYIKYNDSYVSSLFSLQLPGTFNPNTLNDLSGFGYPCVVVVDYEPMTLYEYRMFNKLLEQKYNRKIMDDKDVIYNLSVQIAMITDSKEARKIVESSTLNYMAKNGVVMSPAFEAQEEQFFSMNSFGIVDFKNFRSASKNLCASFMI